ncbi:MAG: tetratricopeptide repeat protein [Candidatus Tectimicrobiota bacterium]
MQESDPVQVAPVDGAAELEEARQAYEAGQWSRAEHLCRQLLVRAPRTVEALQLLGMLAHTQGRHALALVYLKHALALQPACGALHRCLGMVYCALDRLAEAEQHYQWAQRADPTDAEIANNLGVVRHLQGELDGAVEAYRAALQYRPTFAEAARNLGTALQAQGHLAQASAAYRTALALQPDFASAHNNLAGVLQEQGQPEAALAHYEAAIRLEPQSPRAQWNRALLWLAQGNLQQGWPAYEWRWQGLQPLRTWPVPRWDGTPLGQRTLLVWAEQGLGDEILFASCFPSLLAQGGHCVLECEPRLAPLFARSFPSATVVGSRRDACHWLQGVPAPDVQIPAGSLPGYLRPDLESFPTQAGFLRPDPAYVQQYQQRLQALGPGLKVGISWRSAVLTPQRSPYYTALEQWQSILSTPGVHFVNLQYGQCAAELHMAQTHWGVTLHTWDDLDLSHDLDQLAGLMSALDLVLAPDNAVTALAGSVGQTVWRLTVAGGAWDRLGTTHSPWFPSLRAVMQQHWGVWDDVLDRIASALASAVAAGQVRGCVP